MRGQVISSGNAIRNRDGKIELGKDKLIFWKPTRWDKNILYLSET